MSLLTTLSRMNLNNLYMVNGGHLSAYSSRRMSRRNMSPIQMVMLVGMALTAVAIAASGNNNQVVDVT